MMGHAQGGSSGSRGDDVIVKVQRRIRSAGVCPAKLNPIAHRDAGTQQRCGTLQGQAVGNAEHCEKRGEGGQGMLNTAE